MPGTSAMLLRRVHAVRAKLLRVALLHGLARLVIAVVLLVGGGMLLDWALNLPQEVRGLLCVGYVAVFVALIWQGILQPLMEQPDDDTVALMVEHGEPGFRSRLIASLQLTRSDLPEGVSGDLVEKMVSDTEKMAKPIDFGRVVPMEAMFAALALSLVLAGAGGTLYKQAEDGEVFLRRAFMGSDEYPFKTKLVLVPEDGVIAVARGEDVTIKAIARGVLPKDGQVLVYFNEGSEDHEIRELPQVESSGDSATYQLMEKNVHQSFRYIVKVNDGRKEGSVVVRPRPKVAVLNCVEAFPEYTGKGEVKRNVRGQQIGSVLKGSTLKFAVEPSRAVKEAKMRVHYSDGTEDREVDAKIESGRDGKPGMILADLDADNERIVSVSFFMEAEDGILSMDEARFRLGVEPDGKPMVALSSPPDLLQVTSRAYPQIRFRVKDDFGLSRLELRYRIDDGDEKTIPVSLPPRSGEEYDRGGLDFDLDKLEEKPTEGSLIFYRLVATDNNKDTGPGVGISRVNRLEVVSAQVKELALIKRADRIIQRIKLTQGDQEKAREELAEILAALARIRDEQNSENRSPNPDN
ncbi:MAG: hypothetical protein CMO74_14915 [Verrucomicrobiales bacterium]|nr:hypothetical protein [Verrucomicrobiales bacterium]